MYKSYFGRNGQIRFSSPEEYYQLLGYLAKSDGTTAITWENNEDSGAWGSEGRILFYSRRLPVIGSLKYTAGTSGVFKRINRNPFVEHISKYHGFVQGKYQHKESIRRTIPPQYQKYFDAGLRG